MILNEQQTAALVAALNACRVVGIEDVVLDEGMIRGVVPLSQDAAILSQLNIGNPDVKIGVRRGSELAKRISVLDKPTIAVTLDERNNAKMLTIKSGRNKIDFRCSMYTTIKYPKEFEDPEIARIKLTPDTVKNLTKVVNTMGAGHMTLQLTRQGELRVEAVEESSRDSLSLEVDGEVELLGDEKSFVFNYIAAKAVKVLNTITGSGDIFLTIGTIGTLSVEMNGYTIMLMPQLTDDDLGYDD